MKMTPELRAQIGRAASGWVQSLMPTVESKLAGNPVSKKSGAKQFLSEIAEMMSSAVSEIACSWPSDKDTPKKNPAWAKFMVKVIATVLAESDSQEHFITLAKDQIGRTKQKQSRGDAVVANLLGKLDSAMGILAPDEASQYLHTVVPTLYSVAVETQSLAALETRLAQVKPAGCFVATAVYGSDDAEAVQVLRLWRDRTLTSSYAGRLFIRFYYSVGPWLARQVECGYLPARPIRRLLDVIVRAVASQA